MQAIVLYARGIEVSIDLSVGHIAEMRVTAGARILQPLHRAPWIDEPPETLPTGITPGLARLSGDFLCAPFSLNDVEPAPVHGWTGNSAWTVIANQETADGWQAILQLNRTVLGATIIKRLRLRHDHPFLYQEHEIQGGTGGLPVSHHTMSHIDGDGWLSFSPKRVAVTPERPLEPDASRGNYLLAYSARTEDLMRFPDRYGTTTDLTHYRATDRREDFVILVEAEHPGPGWTALTRERERDLILVLKSPQDLPVTMLWLSNGGRQYAPWNGRHLGVIGIEDARSAIGHAASMADNFVSREGVPTTFKLAPDRRIKFRQIIGAASLESATRPVRKVECAPGQLIVYLDDGTNFDLPFDDEFLTDC